MSVPAKKRVPNSADGKLPCDSVDVSADSSLRVFPIDSKDVEKPIHEMLVETEPAKSNEELPSNATCRIVELFLGGEITPLIELRPSNPRRPVHARWDLARHVLSGHKLPKDYLDAQTTRALELQQVIKKCQTEEDLLALSTAPSAWLEMMEAVYIWRAKDAFRDILEARLLTEETFEVIAGKMGVSAEVVCWFESLFFSVRHKLAAPDYVSCVLIGQAEGTELVDPKNTSKWYGYWGGPRVLDAILHGYSREQNHQAAEFFRESFRQTLAMKANLALKSLDATDPKIGIRLLRLWQRCEEVELRRKQVERCEIDISRNLEAFVSELDRAFNRTEQTLRQHFGWLDNSAKCSAGELPDNTPNATTEWDAKLDPLAI